MERGVSDEGVRGGSPLWAAPQSFVEDRSLPYRCLACDAGRMMLVRGRLEVFRLAEAGTADPQSKGLEPGEAGRFSCLFMCANPTCEDIVRCEGDVGWNEDVRWDEDTEDWDVSITPFYTPDLMESEGGSLQLTPVDAADSSAGEPDGVSVNLQLDPTDSLILSHLRTRPTQRLITSDIARQLHLKEKSIGKNLAKLGLAGLIDNAKRYGYRITPLGERFSSETDGR